ncbi:MAG: ABC transporter ATP-binding protein [Schleiferiaceae bacterium]|nr:ABC transporter ATP-binding protein [Schleiferiaceae bacterium]
MIKIAGVTKRYGALEVLKGIDLTVSRGEVVSIVGESGAGKSTLLQIMGTLDQADTGKVWIADTDISTLNDKPLSTFRNEKIGFIFQFHHLLPEFNALENVCLPAFIRGDSQKDAERRGLELLTFLGLKARATHQPNELSGGEQQRVAFARALVNQPAIVFADEPTGNLDSKNADDLHQLVFRLREEFGQTFVIVTHNREFAQMADRVVTMRDGRIL